MPDRYTYPGIEVPSGSLSAILRSPLSGPFDLKRLQETHKAHFDGFYEWAGQLRTEGMMFKQRDSGQVVQYPPSNRVEPYIKGIFEQLRAEQPTCICSLFTE